MQVQEQDIFEQVRNTPNLRTSEFRELLVEHAKTARGIKSEAGIEAAYNMAYEIGHAYGLGEVLIHFVDLLEICEACEQDNQRAGNDMGWLDSDAIIAYDREREYPSGNEEIYGAIRSMADKPHYAPNFLSALVDANYMRGHQDGYNDGYSEAFSDVKSP